jgi:hypothetical protein
MKYVISLSLILLLSACGGGPLSLLTGGGPNVAANVQAGQENTQAVSQVEANQTENTTIDNGGTVTILNNDVPLWYMLLLILGWVLPSPKEIGRGIIAPFRGLTIKRKE